jgi:hypothetical protein
MIEIFIAKGPEQGRVFVVNGEIARIGRGSANQVYLNEPSVSRKHAMIQRDGDDYYIEDLQSRNGTWINGSVIESGVRVQVQEGHPIAIGNVLVSLGKECSPNRLPSQYSIPIKSPGSDGQNPSTFADRRGKQKKELELIYDISLQLMGSLDLNELCERALDSIIGLLKRIDNGVIFFVRFRQPKAQQDC